MKRFMICTAIVCSVLVWAGIPLHEQGLPADNTTTILPRYIEILDAGILTNVDLPSQRNPRAFTIAGTPALFVQCPDAGAWIYTDVTSVGPGTGTMIQAGGSYSTGCLKEQTLLKADGGFYRGCVVAQSPLAGAVNTLCIWHITQGTQP